MVDASSPPRFILHINKFPVMVFMAVLLQNSPSSEVLGPILVVIMVGVDTPQVVNIIPLQNSCARFVANLATLPSNSRGRNGQGRHLIGS